MTTPALLARPLPARRCLVGLVSLISLAESGCAVDLAPQPVLPVEPATKTFPARPLDAGLLSVSADGAFALASDSLGGAVYVIDLSANGLTSRQVTLGGDEPGRAALSPTHAYVTAPRTGAVVKVDLAAGSVVDRFSPCAAPEGVAIEGESLHVACRGGELVTVSLEHGEVERSLVLEEDLRDVVVVPSGLVVSTFTKAALLWLDAEGEMIERTTPPVAAGNEAAVAWRTLLAPDGRVLVAHQVDSDQDLSGGYSGGQCGSIATPTVTGFVPPGVDLPIFAVEPGVEPSDGVRVATQATLAGGAGTFDLAAVGEELVVIFPGNEFRRRFQDGRTTEAVGLEPDAGPSQQVPLFSIQRFALVTDQTECELAPNSEDDSAAPVAITTAAAGPLAGRALVLTLSPATVRVLDSDLVVRLHDEDRVSTGLELFQMTVGSGVSCASCHPGGRADARTWQLARGPRRTQPLEGGVSQLGAFHWDAEFQDFSSLLDDVMTVRMGLNEVLSADRKAALLTFVDGIPGPTKPADRSVEAALRGQALFESEETECATCHSGPALTNNSVADVGTGGAFVTPSLVGVGYRAPLFHDGCASDLLGRFGACGGGDAHGKTSQLGDAEISDLIAYMQTL